MLYKTCRPLEHNPTPIAAERVKTGRSPADTEVQDLEKHWTFDELEALVAELGRNGALEITAPLHFTSGEGATVRNSAAELHRAAEKQIKVSASSWTGRPD